MLKLAARKHGLPSAGGQTLGKEALFAECWAQHSANRPSLPSVWPLRHSAKSPSLLPSRCTYFILLRVVWTIGKVFAECPMKNTRQTGLCRVNSSRVLFAECYTRQSLCRVFSRLCRVSVALGKQEKSSSGACQQEARE